MMTPEQARCAAIASTQDLLHSRTGRDLSASNQEKLRDRLVKMSKKAS